MWEFIAFVLFGLVSFIAGGIFYVGEAVKDGKFAFKGAVHRVTKIEE
jgi:hypothetical protein